MESADWLEIGKIVGVQGLKGEVRIYPNSDFPERFEQPGQRWLLHPNATEPESIELLSGRYLGNKGLYIVQFAGISDREQAEALRDCRLLVPESDRPQLEADEFHVMDLIGLEVFDQLTQTLIGTVVDVLSAGNDLLEVKLTTAPALEKAPDAAASEQNSLFQSVLPKGKRQLKSKSARSEAQSSVPSPPRPSNSDATVLIPFVEAIVPVVDLEQRRIEITPPEGLIEPG
jgi:16S rRNA processing protein RimM